MNFWIVVGLLLAGSLIGLFLWAFIFMLGCPKIGTLILDLSREEKDIAQFVFNQMDLPDIAKYRTCRLDIKTSNLKSMNRNS